MPPAEVAAKLADKMWSTRLAGVQELVASLPTLAEERQTPLVADLALHHLDKVAKDEKNLQVLVQVMECIKAVATAFPLLARRSAARGLRCAVERLGAKQTKPAAFEALHALSSACGPSWSLGIVRDAALAHKNPKVLLEALLWARESVEAFGLPVIHPSEPVAFGVSKIASDHASKDVREAAIGLLIAIRKSLGPLFMSYPKLSELSDPASKQLHAEAAKLDASADGGAAAPAPTARLSTRWRRPVHRRRQPGRWQGARRCCCSRSSVVGRSRRPSCRLVVGKRRVLERGGARRVATAC